VIHEDVDRAEYLTNRLEPLPNLINVCKIGLDSKPIAGFRKVVRELLDVINRPGK
jgi:hypothetical protein